MGKGKHTGHLADAKLHGTDLFGEVVRPKATSTLAARFGVPPFGVLDGRNDRWLDRKRRWLALGLKSEVGRDASVYNSLHDFADAKAGGSKNAGEGISVFDPALCELMYRWFCPAGGQVLDPFAGGSVRGIVAGMLERPYWGCELREEQVEANRQQAVDLKPTVDPVWVCGDSKEWLSHSPLADFVLTCPPYGDLEVYSTDPRDLSNMDWPRFTEAYRHIMMRSVGRLRSDRFACVVVGNYRDPEGGYRDLVGETIRGCAAGGARLYNDAVLIVPTGNAVLRAGGQFQAARKLCKLHQNVLIFLKGDAKRATAAMEAIDPAALA